MRNTVPLLAAALAACGGSDAPEKRQPDEPPAAAAVRDDGRGTPHPGWYVGRTTQGLPARLQVFPGGKVDYLIRARLRCADGSDKSVRAVPNSPPALGSNGNFAHREQGRSQSFLYSTKATGTVDRDRAGGAFIGRARHRDGRDCQVELAWSAELLKRVGG